MNFLTYPFANLQQQLNALNASGVLALQGAGTLTRIDAFINASGAIVLQGESTAAVVDAILHGEGALVLQGAAQLSKIVAANSAGTLLLQGEGQAYKVGSISSAGVLILEGHATAALPGYHPDTLDLESRIIAAGSSISTTHLDAVDAFVVGTYGDGIRSKILDCGLFVGDDLTAAREKLWYVNTATLTNNGFVSGDYTLTGGLNPGSTKWLDTGETISSLGLTATNTHLSFFSLSDTVQTSNRREIGVFGLDNFQLILKYFSPVTSFYRSFGVGSAIEAWANPNPTTGLYLGAAGGASGSYLARNGTVLVTSANGGGGSAAAGNITVFRAASSAPTDRASIGYSIGTYLTTAEMALFNSRFQTLKTALGR